MGEYDANRQLSASDGTPNDYFGSSVFTNGNLALIGAMFATVGNTYQKGAAYVFVKPAKGWKTTSNSIKE
jgi:FG-GAP repeat